MAEPLSCGLVWNEVCLLQQYPGMDWWPKSSRVLRKCRIKNQILGKPSQSKADPWTHQRSSWSMLVPTSYIYILYICLDLSRFERKPYCLDLSSLKSQWIPPFPPIFGRNDQRISHDVPVPQNSSRQSHPWPAIENVNGIFPGQLIEAKQRAQTSNLISCCLKSYLDVPLKFRINGL